MAFRRHKGRCFYCGTPLRRNRGGIVSHNLCDRCKTALAEAPHPAVRGELSPNEARAFVGLPPIPDNGDFFHDRDS